MILQSAVQRMVRCCNGRAVARLQLAARCPAPHRRRLSVSAAAAAAAAPAAAAAVAAAAAAGGSAPAVFGVPAAAIFSASSAVLVPVYALMAFAPASKLTRDALLNSPALYLLLAAAYVATFAAAWQAGLGAALGAMWEAGQAAVVAGSPAALDLRPLAAMFGQPLVTLLAWLHLLTLDVVMAREIALDGLRTGVATAHSVLLCFFFGPTGLISHALTRLVSGSKGR
ncbi:hypothetical protein CHLRE_06g255300v5 [Chlamydomonas reinhardtii]|uniref:Uncharacterized protein n=1 Tax=Chlamydomonas reinhardtii TaxID=3055 RepID=A0A2K3DMA5_CHLRE|nr:uncharacterized protein CHLRE_06g255300v5 [Chlamydomonas reinhardtii]PNW81665.1 hypothetical protein CHLRE_06g255300v5 [Chlamydomonas reinhardtii]